MNEQQARIDEMHRTFHHPVAEGPRLVSQEQAELRYKLIQEELDEYRTAVAKGDLVEILDALADLIVVVRGTASAHGMSKIIDPAFNVVMDSNFSKLDADGNPVPHPTIPGKFGKSDLYQPPTEGLRNLLRTS